MTQDARQCPWCKRWCLKDMACAYIFACGLDDLNKFHIGSGCGRSWCWECGKKFCSQYIDPETGIKTKDAKEIHGKCCSLESCFIQEEYCPGGHNSHCDKRW